MLFFLFSFIPPPKAVSDIIYQNVKGSQFLSAKIDAYSGHTPGKWRDGGGEITRQ